MNKSSNTYLPENTYTLEEFIKAGRSVTISYDALSFKEVLSNGTEISILNVVNDQMILDNIKLQSYQMISNMRNTDLSLSSYVMMYMVIQNYTI